MEHEILNMLDYYWKGFWLFLPKLAVGIIILVIAFFISLWVKKFVRLRLIQRLNDVLLATFLAKIARWVVNIIGFIIFMQVLDLSALASGLVAGASVSAFIIGFAFKDIGENFLAGFILAFDRPFKIGDTVVSEGITGTVEKLNLRTTNIKTPEGHDIYVPNSIILNNPLVNYNKTPFRRHEVGVAIDYGSDPNKAVGCILKMLEDHPDVINDPIPQVIADEIIGGSLLLKARFWFNNDLLPKPWTVVRSEIVKKIREVLDKEGIIMPTTTILLAPFDKTMPIPVTIDSNELPEKTKNEASS